MSAVVVGVGVGVGLGAGDAAAGVMAKLAVTPVGAPALERTKLPVAGVFEELPDGMPFHVSVCVKVCPG